MDTFIVLAHVGPSCDTVAASGHCDIAADATLAQHVRQLLAPYDGQLVMDVCTHVVGSAAAQIARLDQFSGHAEGAERAFLAAIVLEQAAGAHPLRARTLRAYASFSGDDKAAASADDIATRLGIPGSRVPESRASSRLAKRSRFSPP